MKRILYFTNIPAPYTVEFFNDLGKYFDLTVVFEAKNSSERHKSWEIFNAKNFEYIIINDVKNFNLLEKFLNFKRIFDCKNYDFYIVGNYASTVGLFAILWLRMNKLSYAIHADGGMISKDSFFRYHIKKYFIKNADLYFSSGKITTNYFMHYGASENKVFEYPFSSVRLNQIRSNTDNVKYREKLGLPANQKIIISVGQIVPRKGYDVLINAMRFVNTDTRLYIIGGDATPELLSLIDCYKLDNIEFIKFLPFEVILDYMAAADLFVLLTREDIWGLVINEAFSMGTPVLSTNKCVAAVEMIKNGENGYIVESENPVEAAERIDYVLSNVDLCSKMKKNNIQKAKEYTIESMCKSYVKILNEFFERDK